jgi:methionyl-tRNA formyltransferase
MNYNIAFFGTSAFSVYILEQMKICGMSPQLIVTTGDKPQGRHLVLTPNVVKTWALQNNISVFETDKLDDAAYAELQKKSWDVFVVASYGKIIPKRFIELPKYKTLNVHPSLLPLFRGPSPIQSMILEDAEDVGVSIMLIDEEMDHGPILAQEFVSIDEWPPYKAFEKLLGLEGGKLLCTTIKEWTAGSIEPQEQEHGMATYTKKITKEDALIDLNSDPYKNFRKIQAFHEWPVAYFFADKKGQKIRVKITEASFENGELNIKKVIPEGKKEITYKEFQSSLG